MLKSALLTLLLVTSLISIGQTNNEADKIRTVAQAEKFIKKHPNAGI